MREGNIIGLFQCDAELKRIEKLCSHAGPKRSTTISEVNRLGPTGGQLKVCVTCYAFVGVMLPEDYFTVGWTPKTKREGPRKGTMPTIGIYYDLPDAILVTEPNFIEYRAKYPDLDLRACAKQAILRAKEGQEPECSMYVAAMARAQAISDVIHQRGM